MVGDLNDIVARIQAVLPKRWFSDQSPNLGALLAGLATPPTWLHSLVQYVIAQSRLSTSTDFWLDLAALDFFGNSLPRKLGESDSSYCARIQRGLFQEAGTRSALLSALTLLTGSAPSIFEPARCLDTGAYGSGSGTPTSKSVPFAYGQAGGWGSLAMPYQFFISVARPPTPGTANVAGYGSPIGGYGGGLISYIDLATLPGSISDADIQSQISRLLPVNATAWLRIN